MKCFYHPDIDAVGLCKHCSRGICRDCVAEREDGLACRDRHEQAVDDISNLVSRNVRLTGRNAPVGVMAVVIYWMTSTACVYLLTQAEDSTMRLMFGIMAAVLFASAVANTRVLFVRRSRP
jgi:Na+/serine symporter